MRRKLILVIFAIIVAISGCVKEVEEEDYVALVNDEKLTEQEFRSAFSEEQWANMSEDDKEDHLDEWIRLTLLAQECDNQGISEMPEIKRRLSSSEKKIKANALIASELNSIKVSEEELLSFYNLHKNEYRVRSKEYKYQRIFVKGQEKLDEVIKELRAGSKFKDMAIKYSEEPAGRNGGYMGFVAESGVDEEIWNILESLEKYRWKSMLYKDGFLLIRWYEKIDAEIELPFSDVRKEIEKKYREENQKDKYDALLLKLQENSVLEKRLN